MSAARFLAALVLAALGLAMLTVYMARASIGEATSLDGSAFAALLLIAAAWFTAFGGVRS